MQLTLRNILQIFQVSEKVVNEWIDKKKMPCVKINERYRFNYIHLLEWALENNIKLTSEIFNISEAQSEESLLSGAFKRGDIHYDILGNNQEEVLKAVVEILPLPEGMDRSNLFDMLWTRELMGSTAIGEGIAIPHVRNPIILHIDQPMITTCFLRNPIDFNAPDHKPVHTLFIVLSPSVKMHLNLLAHLAYCLQNTKLQECLNQRCPREEILANFFVLESKLNLNKSSAEA